MKTVSNWASFAMRLGVKRIAKGRQTHCNRASNGKPLNRVQKKEGLNRLAEAPLECNNCLTGIRGSG